MEQLLGLIEQRAVISDQLRSTTITCPDHALKFLQPGRLVKVAPGPPDSCRPLPQLGPVPRGAGLGVGDGEGERQDIKQESDEEMEEEGKGGQGEGRGETLVEIMRRIDG